jgi:hypothetical protein
MRILILIQYTSKVILAKISICTVQLAGYRGVAEDHAQEEAWNSTFRGSNFGSGSAATDAGKHVCSTTLLQEQGARCAATLQSDAGSERAPSTPDIVFWRYADQHCLREQPSSPNGTVGTPFTEAFRFDPERCPSATAFANRRHFGPGAVAPATVGSGQQRASRAARELSIIDCVFAEQHRRHCWSRLRHRAHPRS